MGTHMRILLSILCAWLLLASTSLWAQGENQQRDQQFLMASNTSTESASLEILERAEKLFREKNYDEVIRILSGVAYADPANFDVNILLARAQVEKCAILKEAGDPSYKVLIHQPYNTAQRLHRVKAHQELYYIVAKSLLINNRTARAVKTVKKALRLSPGNADYLLVLGDAYSQQAIFARKNNEDLYNSKRLFASAKGVYEEIISLGSAAKELKTRVLEKLKKLLEEMQ